jgi:dihydroflavonol-4-reductase
MTYAITGATGFVGGALAAQLRAAGHGVRALVRDPARAGSLDALGVELVPGDLGDPVALTALCDGTDGLFHVAGWYKLGSRTPEDGERINVEGTRAALAAARDAGIRTVHTSTLAINSDTGGHLVDEDYRFTGTHISTYDRTKAHAHDLAVAAAAEGQDVVVVQPSLVYGPGDTAQSGAFIADVVAGKRPLLSDGGQVCWGYIDDIADGHVRAMVSGVSGRSYFLAGPPASLLEGLRLAAEIAGTPGPLSFPAGGAKALAAVMGAIEKVFPVAGSYSSESVRASLAHYVGSAQRAIDELGWHGRSLREGMELTVAALQAR